MLDQINWEKVGQVIDPEGKLLSFDFEDAKRCVFAGAEKWLVRDLE